MQRLPLIDHLVLCGRKFTGAPWFNVNMLTTAGGEQMISFAKTAQYAEDLYSGMNTHFEKVVMHI